MKEDKAKQQLVKMLGSFTPGSIMHILADIYRDSGDQASHRKEQHLAEQCRMVAATLTVVGIGVDAAMPQ